MQRGGGFGDCALPSGFLDFSIARIALSGNCFSRRRILNCLRMAESLGGVFISGSEYCTRNNPKYIRLRFSQ